MNKIIMTLILVLFSTSVFAKGYEKNRLEVGNYTVGVYGVGSVKVKDKSGKQLIVISGKMKVKFYNGGDKNADISFVRVEDTIKLLVKGKLVMTFNSKYIKEHRATFVQALDVNNKAFAIWIKLPGKSAISLNIEEFQKKIDKAIEKEIPKLAIELDVTEAQIRKVIEDQKAQGAAGDAINDAISNEIENSISNAIDNAVVNTVADQASDAINDAINEAIANGISQAALDAGIAAGQEVLDNGGTEAEALAAGKEAAGL